MKMKLKNLALETIGNSFTHNGQIGDIENLKKIALSVII